MDVYVNNVVLSVFVCYVCLCLFCEGVCVFKCDWNVSRLIITTPMLQRIWFQNVLNFPILQIYKSYNMQVIFQFRFKLVLIKIWNHGS